MRQSKRLSLVPLLGLAARSKAADAAYVTDLGIFSLLAPCASEAVSYNIQSLTYTTSCADNEKSLQACACSNTEQFKSITAAISSSVASNCGSAATEDQQSASKVVQQYCNPATTITFSTPTTNIIEAYITDLSQMAYLPQCAQSALSYAVLGQNQSKCPQAANLFAPCVCSKSGLPSAVSDVISKSVRYSCSNSDDITAAQDFYNEYCAMNQGTTTFTSPPGPPGDMTYHITALSQFKQLRSCAQSGVASAVLQQTEWNCAAGPQALASCACLKSGMSGRVSSSLTSYVKYFCDNTATADVSSALSVWAYYCSAADDKVVASVTETATESYPHPASRTGSAPSKPSETVIAAVVLGVVVIVALVGVVAFILRRRRQRQTKGEQLPPTNGPDGGLGELDNTSKPVAELLTPGYTQTPELQGGIGIAVSELPPYQSPRPELQGNYAYPKPSDQTLPHELASPPPSVYRPSPPPGKSPFETPYVSPATPYSYKGGWQSGPVQEAYELDSTAWAKQG
ncbi:hypothetical protein PT974_10269 [Cladobotryum mycophilum]|uniref:Extracellular membrane protein CFEM domain-containing protein n=1 Tax=Cladobotryum mycophilum TaxID=491253 RepID=A0ABR0S9D3_9HYPO